MIVPVLRLTRWEWFKLRKRWMPRILLGIAVVIAQSFLWSSCIFWLEEIRQGQEKKDNYRLTASVSPTAGSRM